jgi:spermidine/putrescine ABC transporter ATP-binding subunit
VADVSLVSVTKRYDDVTAVDDVSLSIAHGEFVSLLGPSGCGKTTTLRMIAGFIDPTAGEIAVGGRSQWGVPPHKRDTAMVFQDYALFPHKTIAQNLAFGLRMRRRPKQEIAAKVEEMLDLLGLTGVESRRPSQLSGGQQQRIALGRSLIVEPSVLLLDEPLGALDLKLRKQMQIELKRIQRSVGITFVYVTHDQEEALAMSDRIAVMNGGRVEQYDSPEAIYHRPATEFVADFIGDANILRGAVVEAGGRVVVRDAGGNVLAGLGLDGSIPTVGDPASIVVRPEKVRLLMPGEQGENELTGRLREVVFAGSAVKLYAALTNGNEFIVRADRIPALAPSQEIRLSWRTDDAVVIPKQPPTTDWSSDA